MHVFDLPVELLEFVLQSLGLNDLMRCALVCKRWTRIAVEMHWKKREVHFVGLVKIFDPLLKGSRSYATPEKAVTSPGWRLLDRIREKVHFLMLDSRNVATEVTDYVLSLLPSPDAAFCPNLRHLSVIVSEESSNIALYRLSGSHLSRLILMGLAEIKHEVLRGFAERSPSLWSLKLYGPTSFRRFDLFQELRSFTYACSLSFESLIALLQDCPRLEYLSLGHIRDLPAYSEILRDRNVSELPNLKALSLPDPKDRSAQRLLEYLLHTKELPRLREVHADLVGIEPARWTSLIDTLSKRFPNLTKLSISTDDVDWARLVTFRHLCELEISGNKLETYTPQAIGPIIDNNPELRMLSLPNRAHSRIVPGLNVTFLERIAVKCAKIEHLTMTLDAREPISPLFPAIKFKHLATLELNLHIPCDRDWISDLAKYLADLSPKDVTLRLKAFLPAPDWWRLGMYYDETKDESRMTGYLLDEVCEALGTRRSPKLTPENYSGFYFNIGRFD